MSLISCRNVSFEYGGNTVLEDIHFELEAGGWLSVAGENGSGKTTLIRGLAGLAPPRSGSIVFGEGFRGRGAGEVFPVYVEMSYIGRERCLKQCAESIATFRTLHWNEC